MNKIIISCWLLAIFKTNFSMKKQLIFPVLIFVVTTNLLSQNWEPLNLSVKYNYQIDTADYITNTLWIDSVQVIEEDSVFYFNRIMIINPTNNYYAYKNQPQFLMRQIRKESDSLYIFSDTTEFIIKPLANYSDTWIFNEENAVSAEITSETEEEVFGQLDSVKVVSLSNGKSIKISKNFGILEFFDWETDAVYNLVGIEGNQEFGDQVPNFWDFYNFHVGDTIEREEYDYHYEYDNYEYSYSRYEKYIINSVEITTDEVICEISGMYYSYSWDSYGGSYSSAGYFDRTETYTYNNTSITNSYNHELIQLNEFFEEEYEIPYYRNLETNLENDLYTKKVDDGAGINESILYINSGTENLLIGEYIFDDAKLKYTETLGMTEYQQALFFGKEGSFAESNQLLGYIRDGVTYGNVHPDSWYINYMDVENIVSKLKIFPNPAKDYINIDFPENNSQELIIEINDLSGKQILYIQSQYKDQQINVSGLSSGLYFLTIKSNNSIHKIKFVKK